MLTYRFATMVVRNQSGCCHGLAKSRRWGESLLASSLNAGGVWSGYMVTCSLAVMISRDVPFEGWTTNSSSMKGTRDMRAQVLATKLTRGDWYDREYSMWMGREELVGSTSRKPLHHDCYVRPEAGYYGGRKPAHTVSNRRLTAASDLRWTARNLFRFAEKVGRYERWYGLTREDLWQPADNRCPNHHSGASSVRRVTQHETPKIGSDAQFRTTGRCGPSGKYRVARTFARWSDYQRMCEDERAD